MDAISGEALTSLMTTVNALFADLNPLPAVEISPTKITPTGLGGYVGVHEEPIGDLIGRRIEALVRVTVSNADSDVLNSAVLAVQNAVLSLTRAESVEKGIHRASLDPTIAPSEDATKRNLGFRLIYEFVKVPEDAEGIIQEIPLNLSVG